MLHKPGQSVPFTGSTTRYLPFGGYRGTPPSQAITDRDFTGQRENMELGLLYYNARYYLPGIARFISPDTLVPNPTNPQSFNRYSYVRNSPLNFSDPTGHYECEDAYQCSPPSGATPLPTSSSEDSTSTLPPGFPTSPVFDTWPTNPTNWKGGVKSQGFGGSTFSYNHRKGTIDTDPITGEVYKEMYMLLGNLHSGLDIAMSPGQELIALGDGTVVCVGYNCGQSEGSGGQGIGISYPSCGCVVYYAHTTPGITALDADGKPTTVYKGMVVGKSGIGNGYAHLHLEIRPSAGAHTWYNPLYYFTPEAIASANFTFMPYQNNYDAWSMYGYTSEVNGVYGYYWEGTVPVTWP
jgi:RHS repeat-associated protein